MMVEAPYGLNEYIERINAENDCDLVWGYVRNNNDELQIEVVAETDDARICVAPPESIAVTLQNVLGFFDLSDPGLE